MFICFNKYSFQQMEEKGHPIPGLEDLFQLVEGGGAAAAPHAAVADPRVLRICNTQRRNGPASCGSHSIHLLIYLNICHDFVYYVFLFMSRSSQTHSIQLFQYIYIYI